MKASFVAVCATSVVVLASALADTRKAPRLDAASLARVEAVTSYCENVDPVSDSEYVSRVARAMRGHSDADVHQARNSDEYRQALAQANETLAKVPKSSAIRACTEYLAEK
jgi:ABC-type taurine transport system substrate-binding protein